MDTQVHELLFFHASSPQSENRFSTTNAEGYAYKVTQTRVGVESLVLTLVPRLRSSGLGISTSEIMDALSAMNYIDLSHRHEVEWALRTTLLKDSTYETAFHRAFNAVFPMERRELGNSRGQRDVGDSVSLLDALLADDDEAIDQALEETLGNSGISLQDGRSVGHHTQRALRAMNTPELYRKYLQGLESESEFDRSVNAAQAQAAIEQMKRRLDDLLSGQLRDETEQALEDPEDRKLLKAGADELVAMRQAMRPLARRLATKLGNKRRRGRAGLDMRKTIRASMGTGGVPVNPSLRKKRPSKPDLIIICDVSGSTAQFAPFTLTLLAAVHEEFRRVRSFVFIDGIVEITDLIDKNPGIIDPNHLLAKRGLIAHDGRSDYYAALQSFLDQWGESVTSKTTVLIAGDARSHDRPPATASIAEIGHRSRRLYWLNPEEQSEWNTNDSQMSAYQKHCTEAFQVSTIRELIQAVNVIV